MSPRVSIIICTCNRAQSLRLTLNAIGRTPVPPDLPAELLVVDNASTDDTRAVAESARLPNMPVRCIHEPRRGKGNAYNRGMAEARGEVLLYTDDDVRPGDGWIEGMCRPIVDGEADAIAGSVRLAPELERAWMCDCHRGWLAATNWSHREKPSGLVGANMSFSRRATYEAGMRFDPELDPGGLGYYGDSLFGWQIEKRGLHLTARSDVVVDHHVDPSRLERRAFLDTAWKYGRSLAYVTHHWNHERTDRYLVRLARAAAGLGVHRLVNFPLRASDEGVDEKEFRRMRTLAFLLQLRRERRRQRNYEPHGWVKQRGVLPV